MTSLETSVTDDGMTNVQCNPAGLSKKEQIKKKLLSSCKNS